MNTPAKRKTIRKVLHAVVTKWLDSLPEDLRKQVKDDVIVTGGSIVSLLTGDTINDYDLYFRTIESAQAIAQHYANHPDMADYGVTVERREEDNIRGEKELRLINFIEGRASVGDDGREDDHPELANAQPENDAEKEPYRPVFISRNAITLSDRIQLITRFYGEPVDIHKSFDFVHATCWYDYKNDHLELPAKALESILSQTLYYQGSLYPLASIFRMKKFIQRGWRIGAGDMLKIMWQIGDVNLTNPVVLVDQLTGVDLMYMSALIQALNSDNVKPEQLTSSYVGEVIDRIFNT